MAHLKKYIRIEWWNLDNHFCNWQNALASFIAYIQTTRTAFVSENLNDTYSKVDTLPKGEQNVWDWYQNLPFYQWSKILQGSLSPNVAISWRFLKLFLLWPKPDQINFALSLRVCKLLNYVTAENAHWLRKVFWLVLRSIQTSLNKLLKCSGTVCCEKFEYFPIICNTTICHSMQQIRNAVRKGI